MSQLLRADPGAKILEVGTGSGYQAAVLAQTGVQVYSIEIIPTLGERARELLDSLGYDAVRTRVADGYFGWEEHAPFDGIIVTAAPDHVPPPLLRQLKSSGVIVIPMGPPGDVQTLWLIERREGEWVSTNQGLVRFVPLLRE
jgi:protein-L-isoaspartate(D-aspartate) O-methyltransferase